MLYCLVDGRARTSTELAAVADVTPSTASVHLQRLKTQRLVKVFAQGKHRYYSLEGADVAIALESLSVLAGASWGSFGPSTPHRLRAARTCYDHLAGTLGVSLHDRFKALGWLSPWWARRPMSCRETRRRRFTRWASTSTPPAPSVVASHSPVSIGVSDDRISAERWLQRSSTSR